MTPTNFLENVELFVFDVDGVIFDVYDAIYITVKNGINKYHLNVPIEIAMQEVGDVLEIAQALPIPELILNSKELFGDLQLFEGMTVLKRLRIAASFYSDYRVQKDNAPLFPEVETIIKSLHNKGIKLAILSNNKRSYVIEALKKQNLEPYFSLILGFNEVSKTKPDPEGLNKIMETLNVPKEKTVFIGDMITDIQAGKNAGVKTIAIASGLAPREKLEKENPDLLVENLYELKENLGL